MNVFGSTGIPRGCSSIPGYIEHVQSQQGSRRIHTIGDTPAVGPDGSGMGDVVAQLLESGR